MVEVLVDSLANNVQEFTFLNTFVSIYRLLSVL